MSTIVITKGLPVSLLVGVTDDGVAVPINNGEWTTTVNLHFQTFKGPEPFALTTTPTGNSVNVTITGEQTNTLDHRTSMYVLVIRAVKTDGTVNLRNSINVSVVDGI